MQKGGGTPSYNNNNNSNNDNDNDNSNDDNGACSVSNIPQDLKYYEVK